MAIKTYNDQNFVAIANAIRSKNGETTQYKPSEMAAAISAIESALEVLPQDTVSGAIANFPDGSDGYPVVELIANIDYKQEGSTECKVVKHGKNFINVTNTSGTVNGVTFTVNSDSSITCNGTATALTVVRIIAQSGSPINFERGKVYTLSGCPSGGSEQTFQLDLRLTNSTGTFYSNAKDFGNGFTWTDNVGGAAYPIILIRSGYTCNNLTFKPQIEVGTATDYEPYKSEEISISWESEAGTVYGGTLNVTTGELTSTLDSSGDPLPTPEVYQLEPEEVKTLLGVNNIYADTGNVSVTYRADIDLYIAKKIAEGA